MSSRLVVAAIAIACGCAAAGPRIAAPVDRRAAACSPDGALEAPKEAGPLEAALPWGKLVGRVDVEGGGSVPDEVVRRAIRTVPGSRLDAAVVAADVRRLFELEAFEDVRVETAPSVVGVAIAYRLVERPVVGAVFFTAPLEATSFALDPGELYDPVRARRAAADLEARLRAEGRVGATVEVRARRADARTVDVCVAVDPKRKLVIDRIEITGLDTMPRGVLEAAIDTEDGTVNAPGTPFRPDLFERALLVMTLACYDRGLVLAEIAKPEAVTHPDRGTVTVVLRVREGPRFHVGDATVTHAPLALRRDLERAAAIPRGAVFSRAEIVAAGERMAALLRARGRHGELVPDASFDAAAAIANVRWELHAR